MPRKLSVNYKGTVFTRTTDRDYSHIVVGKVDGEYRDFAWAGRYDLAEKQVKRAQKMGYTDVEIVPIPEC